jgi:hypothetical protein
MSNLPKLSFRFDPGYTIDQPLTMREFADDNVVVGKTQPDSPVSAVFLGKPAEYDHMRKNVWLDCDGAHAVYVVGKRRSGKTYTLGVLLEGLASGSWLRLGSEQQAVLMVDTMNVFITMPNSVVDIYGDRSSQVRELKKWALPNEQFDILLLYPKGSSPPPEGRSREVAVKPSDLSGQDWAALFEVDTFSDPIGQLISELYDKVAVEGYEADDRTKVAPNTNYTIDDLLDCLERCRSIAPPRYEQRTIEAVRRRMSAARRLPVFSSDGTNVRDLFVPGQISVLLLRDLDHALRALLVGVLVKQIMQARSLADRFERLANVQLQKAEALRDSDPGDADKARAKYLAYTEQAKEGLPRGWIILDEAHNYLPARGIIASSEPLKKYVNEGRNLGLSIVVATQNPSGLDPAIRRNADLLLIHSMSMRDDIATAEGMVNTFIPDGFTLERDQIKNRVFEQLVRSLPLGYAVLSSDTLSRVTIIKVRPRITVHGGLEY